MAISEAYTNSATISTTPYSLTNNSTSIASQTTDGIYQVFLDLNALTTTETYDIQVLEKATSGGTQRIVYEARVVGAQAWPIWVSPSLVLIHGWDVVMYKVGGTDRSISWSIRQVA